MSKHKIIDLGMHPFSDTFIREDQVQFSEPIFPLQCFLETESGLISTGIKTNTNDRYNLYDYSYTSSNSNFSKKHWNEYAKFLLLNNFINKKSNVLEIGSNDGYLSLQIKDHVNSVLGIDSSKYISELAIKNGINTIPENFTFEQSKLIADIYGKFNLIIANNVLNHIDDLDDFCKGILKVLEDNGKFIFEVPYWKDTITELKYDQIYHEHVNYFTLKSIKFIFNKYNLFIEDYLEVNYHGGSLRIILSKRKMNNKKLDNSIENEENLGLFSTKTYINYQDKIREDRSKLIIKLHEIKLQKFSIIAVGAAAKGNTFLNFHGLDNTIIDYVTDSSEHKIGKYTPLSRIKILSDEEVFNKYEEPHALILSWNIATSLKEKLKKINNKIKFIN